MQHDVLWGPILIFVAAFAVYALYEHMRNRRRSRSSYRSDFRRMESPAARQRRRAAQRDGGRPNMSGRGFAR